MAVHCLCIVSDMYLYFYIIVNELVNISTLLKPKCHLLIRAQLPLSPPPLLTLNILKQERMKTGTQKKGGSLREHGVTNYFIIGEVCCVQQGANFHHK